MKPSVALKLKDMTIAQEMRVIKRLEDQARRRARRLRERAYEQEHVPLHVADPKLAGAWANKEMVGAGVAGADTGESWKKNEMPPLADILARQNNPDQLAIARCSSLHHHRIHVLRPEARIVHLARGFLNGTPYEMMENTCRTSPHWNRVEWLVCQFCENDMKIVVPQFMEWLDAAKAHCGVKPLQHRETSPWPLASSTFTTTSAKRKNWIGILAIAATFIAAAEMLMFFLFNWRSSCTCEAMRMADNEDLVALLRALPPDFNVDVREGSAWMRCPNPEHAQTGATPPFKITTEIGPYMGSSHCFACGIGGNLKKTLQLLGLRADSTGLRTDEPYDIFSESEEEQLRGGARTKSLLVTEDWDPTTGWRGIGGQLICDVGGRMQIAGDGREPSLILPVVMRGVQKGYIKCRCFPQDDGRNYINAGSNWARDALFPYDFVKSLLDSATNLRIVAIVEGSRDALATIQNGLPALATLGSQSWSPKCVTAVRSLNLDIVVIIADPDEAGDMLANRVYNDLHDHLTCKVVKLPSKIVETPRGQKRVKVLDPADLSRAQLAKVLLKVGVEQSTGSKC